MSMWCLSGRTFVSLCRCATGVDCVHSVAMRSALFCVICSFLMCVSAVSADQSVCAYVRMGRMNCLYSIMLCSLECPKVV